MNLSCSSDSPTPAEESRRVSVQRVQGFHTELKDHHKKLAQAGYDLKIKMNRRHDLESLTLSRTSSQTPSAQDLAVVENYTKYLANTLEEFDGKWVYFQQSPVPVLSSTSRRSIELNLENSQLMLTGAVAE